MSQKGSTGSHSGSSNGSIGKGDGAGKMSAKDLYEQRKKYSNSNVIMHETSQYHVQQKKSCVLTGECWELKSTEFKVAKFEKHRTRAFPAWKPSSNFDACKSFVQGLPKCPCYYQSKSPALSDALPVEVPF